MTFSNPAGNAAGAAAAYVRALLDLLGPRDPLVVMRELLRWLEDRLRGVGDARLRQPEAPRKWSVIEVIQHLADSDLVATRIAGPASFATGTSAWIRRSANSADCGPQISTSGLP